MSLAIQAVRKAVALPVGVNVMRNDALSALALAAVTGAPFIRVNVLHGVMAAEEGIIEGQAYDVLRYRKSHCPDVRILADILVKHATPMDGTGIVRAARATLHRGGADALIVSGPVTGEPTDLQDLAKVRAALPTVPLFVGSGATEESVQALLKEADGVIIGTSLKEDGLVENAIDLDRVKRLAHRAGAA
jgi:membrane complex biogenesis BtpA family protein